MFLAWLGTHWYHDTDFSATLTLWVSKALIRKLQTNTLFLPTPKQPFNKKENAFIVIMASAAANSALGTEVLAVQRLYYNFTPNPGASIL